GTDAGRADLPGAGDGARHGSRRLYAGRGRPPAALDGGLETQRRTRAVRTAAEERHEGQRLPGGIRRRDLPPDPRLRRIRLSGVALGELRAAGLRLFLAQVPPPGGVL